MSATPGDRREAYLNAAALIRAHHLSDREAEAHIADQLDDDERRAVIETLTSVATWLLGAYSRKSNVPAAAALDLLLETINEEPN